MKKISLLIIFSFLLAGCASITGSKKIEEVKQKLQGKENIMTFDEAIKEFGVPDSCGEGDEIIFAKWTLEKPDVIVTSYYDVVAGSYRPVSVSVSGKYLEMIFDKKTKLLKEWKIKKQK